MLKRFGFIVVSLVFVLGIGCPVSNSMAANFTPRFVDHKICWFDGGKSVYRGDHTYSYSYPGTDEQPGRWGESDEGTTITFNKRGYRRTDKVEVDGESVVLTTVFGRGKKVFGTFCDNT